MTDSDFERAVRARYEYEMNCFAKYDYHNPFRPNRPIPVGERLIDYAVKYNVSMNLIKLALIEVERRYPLLRERIK